MGNWIHNFLYVREGWDFCLFLYAENMMIKK